MFLETERLVLRKFQAADFPDFCILVMDPERNRMIGNDDILTVEEAQALFHWLKDREERSYAIVLKETGRVIGNLNVYNTPSQEIRSLPELRGKAGRSLSFSISRQYRRRGLMYEALCALIERLFRLEGVDYISDGYFDFNLPSRALHQKLGFSYLTAQRFQRGSDGVVLTGVECILWRDEQARQSVVTKEFIQSGK